MFQTKKQYTYIYQQTLYLDLFVVIIAFIFGLFQRNNKRNNNNHDRPRRRDGAPQLNKLFLVNSNYISHFEQ